MLDPEQLASAHARAESDRRRYHRGVARPSLLLGVLVILIVQPRLEKKKKRHHRIGSHQTARRPRPNRRERLRKRPRARHITTEKPYDLGKIRNRGDWPSCLGVVVWPELQRSVFLNGLICSLPKNSLPLERGETNSMRLGEVEVLKSLVTGVSRSTCKLY